jgi:hypothetical protein
LGTLPEFDNKINGANWEEQFLALFK